MAQTPIVRRIKLTSYRFPTQNVTTDLAFAAGPFYEPGSHGTRRLLGIHIETDAGVTGEYISGTPANREQIEMIAPFLIGRNALDRELFYRQSKMILRKHDRMGIGTDRHRALGPCGQAVRRADSPTAWRLSREVAVLREHIPCRPLA